MALQAVGTSNFLSAPLGTNPTQLIGTVSIALLAINALSNLPMVKADIGFDDGAKFSWKACDIVCEPLPGGKDDIPERICVETCEQGEEIIKTTTKEVMKDGKWKTVEVLGKVFGSGLSLVDCTNICDPSKGGPRAMYDFASAGWKLLWNKDAPGAVSDATQGAAKVGCLALLATPAGYGGCMACCAGTKYVGVS